MHGTLRLTSKRQVTFPAAVCAELAVRPGDTLKLRVMRDQGKRVWVIEPPPPDTPRPWLGCLRAYAERKASHEMADIRATVAQKRGART